MLVRVQTSPLCSEENVTVRQYFLFSVTVPRKQELVHKVSNPPEAPSAGTKSKQSKCLGAKFLIKAISK
jgi:hypothetical protein